MFSIASRDELREFLRTNPTPVPVVQAAEPVKMEAAEEEEDYKDHERMQARLRELQMEQKKTKSKKDEKNTKKKSNKQRMIQFYELSFLAYKHV